MQKYFSTANTNTFMDKMSLQKEATLHLKNL